MRGDAAKKAREDWVEAASAHDAATDPCWTTVADLRHALASTHALLASAPDNLLRLYDAIDEAKLQKKARDMGSFPDTRQRVSPGDDAEKTLLAMARLLRLLDDRLHEQVEGPVLRPEEEWACEECDVFVVPVASFGVDGDGPKTNQSFTRRALRHHRILARSIGGVAIHLTKVDDIASTSLREGSASTTFGTALVPDFSFMHEELPGKRFIVTQVDCPGGMPALIDLQLDAFRGAGCDVVVWPELTIDLDLRKHIVTRLGTPASEGTLHPTVVVAGSWHVERNGAHANECVVFDGRGDDLLSFDKMRLFRFRGLDEAIEPGGDVEVLVMEDQLLAFAICKDFCDRANGVPPPIRRLDVDVAVVPSMGDEKTISAHLAAASDMKIAFGTRSVVVQQNIPGLGLPTGFLMSLPDVPPGPHLGDMASESHFNTFQRFKTGRVHRPSAR